MEGRILVLDIFANSLLIYKYTATISVSRQEIPWGNSGREALGNLEFKHSNSEAAIHVPGAHNYSPALSSGALRPPLDQ